MAVSKCDRPYALAQAVGFENSRPIRFVDRDCIKILVEKDH